MVLGGVQEDPNHYSQKELEAYKTKLVGILLNERGIDTLMLQERSDCKEWVSRYVITNFVDQESHDGLRMKGYTYKLKNIDVNFNRSSLLYTPDGSRIKDTKIFPIVEITKGHYVVETHLFCLGENDEVIVKIVPIKPNDIHVIGK
jgi:hypothetical protein